MLLYRKINRNYIRLGVAPLSIGLSVSVVLSLVIVLSLGHKVSDELALSCILDKLFLGNVAVSVKVNRSSL